MYLKSRYERGGVLVMTLLMLTTFVVMMIAWMQFAVRQNNVVVQQEQEEQSFHMSEAGLHYTLHLLNSGECTPDELDNEEPIVQRVTNEATGERIGTYEIRFNVTDLGGGESSTLVRVRAYDEELPGRCQELDGTVLSFDGGTKYRILSWDQKIVPNCRNPRNPRSLDCD